MSIGDIVKLASGGPDMTVSAVAADSVTCQWMSETTVYTGTFAVGTLQPVQGPVETE